MNPRTLTIDDVASALGHLRPVHHHQRVCLTCGGDELQWADELTRAGSDCGTGDQVETCAACGGETGARREVGT